MKKKIIPVIISALMFISGCIAVIIGAAQSSGTVKTYPEINLFGISENDGILTADEAMMTASDASWEQKNSEMGTEWSCVYNLDEFSFDICLDRDYETKFSFTRDDFR